MVGRRVILGATGPDGGARDAARRLRDEGRDVVFVGGGQSAEQLLHAALAEDADEIIVSAAVGELARIEAVRAALQAFGVAVTPLVPRRPQ